MERTGLVTRTPSPEDRRRTELSVTPTASTLLARLTRAHLAEYARLEHAFAAAQAALDSTSAEQMAHAEEDHPEVPPHGRQRS